MELTPEQQKFADEQEQCYKLLEWIDAEFAVDDSMNAKLDATCAFLTEIDKICTTEESINAAHKLIFENYFL